MGIAWGGVVAWGLGDVAWFTPGVIHGTVVTERSIVARGIYAIYLCTGYSPSDTLT